MGDDLEPNRRVQQGALIASVVLVILGWASWVIYRFAQMEQRIIVLEAGNAAQDRRVDFIDQNGTRKLELIEGRQMDVIRRLERLEREHTPPTP